MSSRHSNSMALRWTAVVKPLVKSICSILFAGDILNGDPICSKHVMNEVFSHGNVSGLECRIGS
eukprot:1743994-Prorocentrum_lima.AAC.1